MTKIKAVVDELNRIAPPSFSESYDNPGLLCGDADKEVTGVLTCLDCTEKVVMEACEKGCNLIVAHHPVIFKGLKQIIGQNFVERTLISAIKNDIAIYAIHTNIDNILHGGVSERLGKELGLEDMNVLSSKKEQVQLDLTVLQLRVEDANRIAMQISGHGFDEESAIETTEGPRKNLRWYGRSDFGNAIFRELSDQGMSAKKSRLNEPSRDVGLGVVGYLPVPLPERVFFEDLKEKLGGIPIRHTRFLDKSIHKVALCGGAGASLLSHAKGVGADIFITGDFKYHEFFDADGGLIIADIGHYESEQWTIPLLKEWISKKFSTFAVHCTKVNTNPVNYF